MPFRKGVDPQGCKIRNVDCRIVVAIVFCGVNFKLHFLLLILGLAAFLTIFLKLIILYSEKILSALVERKHRDAEAILSTGIVPPQWAKKGINYFVGDRISKSIVIRRLDKVIKYFQHSPLVESDDAREILVGRLRSIQESWRKMNWKEMYPYE